MVGLDRHCNGPINESERSAAEPQSVRSRCVALRPSKAATQRNANALRALPAERSLSLMGHVFWPSQWGFKRKSETGAKVTGHVSRYEPFQAGAKGYRSGFWLGPRSGPASGPGLGPVRLPARASVWFRPG